MKHKVPWNRTLLEDFIREGLRLAASQERQNNYLVNELKPCPIPAYITCNPYQSYGYTYSNNGCGCNTGCNCGNF